METLEELRLAICQMLIAEKHYDDISVLVDDAKKLEDYITSPD